MEESRNQFYKVTDTSPSSDLTSGGKDGYRKIKKPDMTTSYLSMIS